MIAILITSLILGMGEPTPVEMLSLKSDAIRNLTKAELKVVTGGQTVTYTGVALASVLASRNKPVEGMPGLRDLADAVLLVRGEDGYQAAVSAVAVAMDPQGERFFLATSRDGQARPPQLIIPGDPKHARWVRDVVSVRLVRLGALVPNER